VHGIPDRYRCLRIGFGACRPRSAYPPAGGSTPMTEGLFAGEGPRDRANSPAVKPAEPLAHLGSEAPFAPHVVGQMSPRQERFYMASEWRMVWWKLRRHRIAVVSGAILLVMYVSILFCEFLAPYGLDTRNSSFIFTPPQVVRILHDGRLVAPFVYGFDYRL